MLFGDSKKGETRSLRNERAMPALAQPPPMGAGPSSGRRTRVADASNQAPPHPGQGSNSNASRSASLQSARSPSANIRFNQNAASSPPSNASARSLQGDSSRRRMPVVPPTTQHSHNLAPQTRRDDGALRTQQEAPIDGKIDVPNEHDVARQDSVSSYSSGPSIGTLDALYPLDTDQILTWSLADAATAPRSYYTASKSTSGTVAAAMVTAPSEGASVANHQSPGLPPHAMSVPGSQLSRLNLRTELFTAPVVVSTVTPETSQMQPPGLLHAPPTLAPTPTPPQQHLADQITSEQRPFSPHNIPPDCAVIGEISKLQGSKRHKGSSALQFDGNVPGQASSTSHVGQALAPWPPGQPSHTPEPEAISDQPALKIPPHVVGLLGQDQPNPFQHISEPDSTAFLDAYHSPTNGHTAPLSSSASLRSVDDQDSGWLHPSPGNQPWQAEGEEPARHQRPQPSSFSAFLPQAAQEACIKVIQAAVPTGDDALQREGCTEGLGAVTAEAGALQGVDVPPSDDSRGTQHTGEVVSLFSSGGGPQVSASPVLDWFHATVPSRSHSYFLDVGSEVKLSSTGGSAGSYLFSAQQSQALSEEEALLQQKNAGLQEQQGTSAYVSHERAQQQQQLQEQQQQQRQLQQEEQHNMQQEQLHRHLQQEQQARQRHLQQAQESQEQPHISPAPVLSLTHPSKATQACSPKPMATPPVEQPDPDEAAQRASFLPLYPPPAAPLSQSQGTKQLADAEPLVPARVSPLATCVPVGVNGSKHDADMALALQAATVAALHQSSVVQQQLLHLQQQQQEILSHVQQAAQFSPAPVHSRPGSSRAVREVVDAVTALAASLTPPSRLRRARVLRPDRVRTSSCSPSSPDLHVSGRQGLSVEAHESCKKCGQSILPGTGAKRRHDYVDPRSSRPPSRRRSSGIESDFLHPITLNYSTSPSLAHMVSTGTQTKTPPQDKANQTEPQPALLHQQPHAHSAFTRGLSLIPETSPSPSSDNPNLNETDACQAQPVHAPPTIHSPFTSEVSSITGLPAIVPPQATFLQRLAGVASQRPEGRSVSSLDDSHSQHTHRHQHAGTTGYCNVPESHTSGTETEEGKGYASVPAWVANTGSTILYPTGGGTLTAFNTKTSTAPPSSQGALLWGLSVEELRQGRLRRRQQQQGSDLAGVIADLPAMPQVLSQQHFLSPSKAYGATFDVKTGQAPLRAAFAAHLETPGLQSHSQSILGPWTQHSGPNLHVTGSLHSRNPVSWGGAAADNLGSAQVNVEPGPGNTPFINSSPGLSEPAAKRLRSDWPSTVSHSDHHAQAFGMGAPNPPGMFGHYQQGWVHVGDTNQQQQRSYLSHVRSLVASNHQLQRFAPPGALTAVQPSGNAAAAGAFWTAQPTSMYTPGIGMTPNHVHGQGMQVQKADAAFPSHLLPPSLIKASGARLDQIQRGWGSDKEQENGTMDGVFGGYVPQVQSIFRPVLQQRVVHHKQRDPNQQGQQYIEQQQQQGYQQSYHHQQQQQQQHAQPPQQALEQQCVQGQHDQQQQQEQQQAEDLRLLQLLSQNTLLQLQQQPLDPQMDVLLQMLHAGEMWGAQSTPAQPRPAPELGYRSAWQPPPSETSEMLNRYLHE